MKRNVYLSGELAEKYGSKLLLKADTMQDVFKILNANDPSLKQYLMQCEEKDIGFTCEVEDKSLNFDECILPLKEGDIYISPIPSGSKSAGAKILTALAIAALFVFAPASSFLFATSGTGLSIPGLIIANIGVSLAMAGIQQMMAPDPATDKDGPESYLFNGSQQNVSEGDPIPLLYGELRVPGRPINFELRNTARAYSSGTVERHRVEDQGSTTYMGLYEEILGDGSIETVPHTDWEYMSA